MDLELTNDEHGSRCGLQGYSADRDHRASSVYSILEHVPKVDGLCQLEMFLDGRLNFCNFIINVRISGSQPCKSFVTLIYTALQYQPARRLRYEEKTDGQENWYHVDCRQRDQVG